MKNIKYDSKYDVLYITLSEMKDPYGEEGPSGIVIHREFETDEICAITILEFSKRISAGSELPLILPAGIDFKKDIMPYLH